MLRVPIHVSFLVVALASLLSCADHHPLSEAEAAEILGLDLPVSHVSVLFYLDGGSADMKIDSAGSGSITFFWPGGYHVPAEERGKCFVKAASGARHRVKSRSPVAKAGYLLATKWLQSRYDSSDLARLREEPGLSVNQEEEQVFLVQHLAGQLQAIAEGTAN